MFSHRFSILIRKYNTLHLSSLNKKHILILECQQLQNYINHSSQNNINVVTYQ